MTIHRIVPEIEPWWESIDQSDPPVDLGGGGGNNGKMDARVTALEKAIIRIDAILPTLATREDLHKEINSQTWRFVTFVTTFVALVGSGLTAAVYFIAKHVTP